MKKRWKNSKRGMQEKLSMRERERVRRVQLDVSIGEHLAHCIRPPTFLLPRARPRRCTEHAHGDTLAQSQLTTAPSGSLPSLDSPDSLWKNHVC